MFQSYSLSLILISGSTTASYCCSVAKSCLTICIPTITAQQAFLSFTISWSLLKLLSIESVIPSNILILCGPLLLLLSVFPSIRVFSNELTLHIRWPNCWSSSFSISPSNHPLQHSFLENSMDRGAWQATVHGVTKSWT